jgi:hypothetical protein
MTALSAKATWPSPSFAEGTAGQAIMASVFWPSAEVVGGASGVFVTASSAIAE